MNNDLAKEKQIVESPLRYNTTLGMPSTVGIAKTSYKDKHTPTQQAFIEEQWQTFKDHNPSAFNGEKVIFYLRPDKADRLKLIPSDYANFRAYLQKDSPEDRPLRPHYTAGVIIVCRTSDNKLVVGSREATRKKDNPGDFKAQFPCGFIDVDTKFYEDASKGVSIEQKLKDNALRELKEEVYDFSDAQIRRTKCVGAITVDHTWPSKRSITKSVQTVKSFVVVCDVKMTAEELKAARIAKPPQDVHEMRTMETVSLQEILPSPEATAEVMLEGKKRSFVAEHGTTFNVLAEHEKANALGQIRTPSYMRPTLASALKDKRLSSEDVRNQHPKGERFTDMITRSREHIPVQSF